MAERVGFVPDKPASINGLGGIETARASRNLSIRYKTGTAQSPLENGSSSGLFGHPSPKRQGCLLIGRRQVATHVQRTVEDAKDLHVSRGRDHVGDSIVPEEQHANLRTLAIAIANLRERQQGLGSLVDREDVEYAAASLSAAM